MARYATLERMTAIHLLHLMRICPTRITILRFPLTLEPGDPTAHWYCPLSILTLQIYPHTSFAEEVDFLQTMFAGSAYVHGPLNSDHWYTYVADDYKKPTSAAADRTLNLMMYDLEKSVCENFYKSDKVR